MFLSTSVQSGVLRPSPPSRPEIRLSSLHDVAALGFHGVGDAHLPRVGILEHGVGRFFRPCCACVLVDSRHFRIHPIRTMPLSFWPRYPYKQSSLPSRQPAMFWVRVESRHRTLVLKNVGRAFLYSRQASQEATGSQADPLRKICVRTCALLPGNAGGLGITIPERKASR